MHVRSLPLTRHRGRSSFRLALFGGLVVVAVTFVGCRPSGQDLAGTLPTKINGQPTLIKIVDASFLSGFVGDDALKSLGKTRQDASIATATVQSNTLVAAIAVNGTGGVDLLDAMTKTWPATGSTTPATIAGKSLVRRDGPTGGAVYFYVRGSVVYVVETADQPTAESIFQALP